MAPPVLRERALQNSEKFRAAWLIPGRALQNQTQWHGKAAAQQKNYEEKRLLTCHANRLETDGLTLRVKLRKSSVPLQP